jgi:oligogalacturonide lyase
MQAPASRSWHVEDIPRLDQETGIAVTQMTSAPLIHENIYPEAPIFTPDSRFFVYARSVAPDQGREYWLADLSNNHLRRLTDERGATAPAISPDGRWMYYLVEDRGIELKRLSLETYERESLLRVSFLCEAYELGTIRHDGQAYVTSGTLGPNLWGVVKFDLVARTARVILQTDQLCNAHPQYSPAACNDLLIQENHGCKFDDQGRCVALTSGYGADLHVISDEGSNLRDVYLGRSDLEMIQGHQCWVGDTGRVLSTLIRRDTPNEVFRSDRLVTITPGLEDREVVGLGRAFSHPCVTRDARWWVCDEAGTGDIFLGSLLTRRYCLLVHSRSSFGAPQYTHPHPAFSPDGTKVLFNSDVTGVPQVYVAHVTAEVTGKVV